MAILPIYTLGDEVLRQLAEDIETLDARLKQLIPDMFETMYQADGIGLAAPQIGESINLLVVDTSFTKDGQDTKPLAIINPQILSHEGHIVMEEGCLSIPYITETVDRPEIITLKFRDDLFRERTETFSGLTARVILHEYDHLLGKLFVDYLSPLKKTILKNKFRDIQRGTIETDYILAKK